MHQYIFPSSVLEWRHKSQRQMFENQEREEKNETLHKYYWRQVRIYLSDFSELTL